MASRRRRKEELKRLKHGLESKKLENQNMSHEDFVLKKNKHRLMRKRRQDKRRLKRLNKFQRLLKWRKRKKQREKDKLPNIDHRKDKAFGKIKDGVTRSKETPVVLKQEN